MPKKELSIQDKAKVLSNPSWEEVYQTLESVDGALVSQASLRLENIGFMTVAGGEFIEEKGKRVYIVKFFDGHGDFHSLIDPAGDPERHYFLATGRVATDIADVYLVGFQEVVQAWKHFYETGERHPVLSWE